MFVVLAGSGFLASPDACSQRSCLSKIHHIFSFHTGQLSPVSGSIRYDELGWMRADIVAIVTEFFFTLG
jgi:hypothetical protein